MIAGAALLCLVGVGLFLRQNGPPLSDTDQIREVLSLGEEAVESHNVPAMMGLVSKDYKDDMGFNKDRLRLLAMNAFRDQESTWVTLDNVSIQPKGDSAVVNTDLTVESTSRQSENTTHETYPITLTLRKEPGYRFLVLPTQRWRVIKASGAGLPLGGDLLEF